MASPETFYPDAHEETSSVDGWLYHFDAGGLTWANIVGATGNAANDSATAMQVGCRSDANNTTWDRLDRSIILFDTSGLPDGATVTGATLSLYGYLKQDEDSNAPTINIYKSTPFANTALQNDDYVDIGTQALATAITYAAFDAAGYNVFTLIDVDTDDFGYISLTGITKLGVREAKFDVAEELDPGNHTPNWTAGNKDTLFGFYSADRANTTEDPKLIVTYTVPVITGSATLSGSGTLSAKGVRIFTGSATLSGAGTLAAIGRGIFTGKATLSGAGTLSAIGSFLRFGKATLSGIGSLSAIGRGIFAGKATLSGVGSLSASGFSFVPVYLTLKVRAFVLNLKARAISLTLKERVFSFTLKEK